MQIRRLSVREREVYAQSHIAREGQNQVKTQSALHLFGYLSLVLAQSGKGSQTAGSHISGQVGEGPDLGNVG
jgi:hypothetical protein